MRRTASLLALAALLVAVPLGGCGDDADDVVADDPDTSATSPPDDPADPTDTTTIDSDEPGPRVVTPEPGLLNPIPSAIESVALVDGGDGTKLEVRFYNGIEECYGLDRVEVDETAEQVTIGVFTGGRPPGDQACIDIAELHVTIVTLDAPLGDREVIDASTAAPVGVGPPA